jgi:hypothetical protein
MFLSNAARYHAVSAAIQSKPMLALKSGRGQAVEPTKVAKKSFRENTAFAILIV